MGRHLGWLVACFGIAAGFGYLIVQHWLFAVLSALFVAAGLVGFYRLRWKMVPFSFDRHRGSPFVSITYKPGSVDEVLRLKLKHPESVRVIAYEDRGDGKLPLGGWSSMDPAETIKPVQQRGEKSILTIPTAFEPDHQLRIYLQRDDGGDLTMGDLTLLRRL